MDMDRAGLAEFLRHRRSTLQPEDVGLQRGRRRRTEGLRREEVAALCHMSTDYYSRIEREVGPQPSAQMIASIAQGLHLSVQERDHLFRLAGHEVPTHEAADDHVSPGMLRILDRLGDTPAEIVTELGETLLQTPLGTALTGDTASLSGPSRSLGYRWFAEPQSRSLYAEEDHAFLSRLWASALREVVARRGPNSRAARFADVLLEQSDEFRTLWEAHEVGLRPGPTKRLVHPELGRIELNCQTLVDPEGSHALLVYTAIPGSESAHKLELLSVIGSQRIAAG
jgi:transcriptional regulator with XRE-family HTH domain